jgi:outer membrane protein assembly factor BamB
MRTLAALFLLTLTATLSAAEGDWNQYRGPTGDGHSAAKGLPLTFSETENVTWKTPIAGKAWSSPVVWDKQIWLTNATEDGKQLSAVCVDLDSGKVVHDVLVFDVAEPQYCHPLNSYATPTPFVEAGRVYVHFGAHGTACLDTQSGKTLWSRDDLPCNHFRGPASSPIVYGELLIAQFDGFDQQYVVALNKCDGSTVWKTARAFDYRTNNGDLKKAYCTPSIIEHAGRTQLITPAAVATEALDPATGKLLWTVHHEGMNASARPVFGHGLVFITNGMGRMVAVRPDGAGDVTDSHIAWASSKSIPKKSSQLLIGDLLFMVSDTGVVSCVEAKTGEVHWSERLAGEYAASPLYAEGRIYLFNQDGEVPVIAPARELKVLATNKLSDGFMASPAIAGKALILRTTTHLYRVERQD